MINCCDCPKRDHDFFIIPFELTIIIVIFIEYYDYILKSFLLLKLSEKIELSFFKLFFSSKTRIVSLHNNNTGLYLLSPIKIYSS